jgi:Papain family cysteine protease
LFACLSVGQGWARVKRYNDLALMHAVYSRGPIAISLDASQKGFRFYSSGIFDDPACMWKVDDLDHAVLLVGYGTTAEGIDYWIVKWVAATCLSDEPFFGGGGGVGWQMGAAKGTRQKDSLDTQMPVFA